MENNVVLKNLDSYEFSAHKAQLRKNGYVCVQNAYWIEVWSKDGWTVQLERR